MNSSMKASIFDKTSFCVRILGSCESLQEALSPFLHKFSEFTTSTHVFIELACFPRHPLQDCRWPLPDLAAAMVPHAKKCYYLDLPTASHSLKTRQPPLIRSVDDNNKDVLTVVITHVQDCFFVFRVFDFLGNEKAAFPFSSVLRPCFSSADESAYFSMKSKMEDQTDGNYIEGTPAKTQIIENLSVKLNKTAAQIRRHLSIPLCKTTALPFSQSDCEITVLVRAGNKFRKWKLGYAKRRYANGYNCRLKKGWKNLACTLDLKQGYRCDFTLFSSRNWVYELKIIKDQKS